MSWSRLRFDDCAYLHRVAETVGPGEYMTQTPRICNECSHYTAGVFLDRQAGSIRRGDETQLTDINSELLGITRPSSECPTKKYLGPSETNVPSKQPILRECSHPNDLSPEPTLISNPKCTNKETTINRWEWLCKDPQSDALARFDHNISNRIIVKDNHRPCIEKPLDQSALLPPPCNKDVIIDWTIPFRDQQQSQLPEVPVLMSCRSLREMNCGK
jgi:hypothetical protein